MDDIVTYRNRIDQIDQDIRKLFIQRMETVTKVAKWKSMHNYPIFDPSREESMIQKNVEAIECPDYKKYYQEFLVSLLKVSKEYQIYLLSRGVL